MQSAAAVVAMLYRWRITVFSKDDLPSLYLLQKNCLLLFNCATLIYWEPLINFSQTVNQSSGGQRWLTKQPPSYVVIVL